MHWCFWHKKWATIHCNKGLKGKKIVHCGNLVILFVFCRTIQHRTVTNMIHMQIYASYITHPLTLLFLQVRSIIFCSPSLYKENNYFHRLLSVHLHQIRQFKPIVFSKCFHMNFDGYNQGYRSLTAIKYLSGWIIPYFPTFHSKTAVNKRGKQCHCSIFHWTFIFETEHSVPYERWTIVTGISVLHRS